MTSSHAGRSRPAVVFAGGGTGGHIFPAVAIGERVIEHDPAAHTEFWVSDRAVDASILNQQVLGDGLARWEALPAKPVGLRPRALLRFLGSWAPSVRQARARFRALKAEHSSVHLVATGGFVAAPAVQAARVERVPVTLVNLDAAPGKANRWAARHADAVYTAADAGPTRWKRVRPIVRSAAIGGDPRACREALGLDPGRPTLLVTGGSQGARTINDMVAAMLDGDRGTFEGWQAIHQTGDDAAADIMGARYDAAGVPAIVRPFIAEVGLAWGAAECAVGRAGAGTVAEAWANATPTVFMPYPWHRDQHQRLNAAVLAGRGAAVTVSDERDGSANARGQAGAALRGWLGDPLALAEARGAFSGLEPADGASEIARAVVDSASAAGSRAGEGRDAR